MKSNGTALLAAAAMLLALGACNKAGEPPRPEAQAPASSNQSVAAPPSATPPSDAAIKPAETGSATSGTGGGDSAGISGHSNTANQSHPTELSKQQEQTTMPQSGQTNNYSPPDTTPTPAPKQ